MLPTTVQFIIAMITSAIGVRRNGLLHLPQCDDLVLILCAAACRSDGRGSLRRLIGRSYG